MIPRHYDVAAIRAAGRRDSETLLADAIKLASNEQSRQFVAAQCKLGALLVEFAALQAELINEGVPDDAIASAGGLILGQMLKVGQQTFASRPDLMVQFFSYLDKGMNGPAAGEVTVGGKMTIIEPMQGGHA